MTNATKGNLVAAVNAILGMLVGLGALDLTDAQIGSIVGAVNAVALVVISLTYKASPKRVPDTVTLTPGPTLSARVLDPDRDGNA